MSSSWIIRITIRIKTGSKSITNKYTHTHTYPYIHTHTHTFNKVGKCSYRYFALVFVDLMAENSPRISRYSVLHVYLYSIRRINKILFKKVISENKYSIK